MILKPITWFFSRSHIAGEISRCSTSPESPFCLAKFPFFRFDAMFFSGWILWLIEFTNGSELKLAKEWPRPCGRWTGHHSIVEDNNGYRWDRFFGSEWLMGEIHRILGHHHLGGNIGDGLWLRFATDIDHHRLIDPENRSIFELVFVV